MDGHIDPTVRKAEVTHDLLVERELRAHAHARAWRERVRARLVRRGEHACDERLERALHFVEELLASA